MTKYSHVGHNLGLINLSIDGSIDPQRSNFWLFGMTVDRPVAGLKLKF